MLPYAVETVADYSSFRGLFIKRLRWMTVMRHMRPWGHAGLIFTHGLAWSLLAVAVHPTWTVAAIYLGGYVALRLAMSVLVGAWGLHEKNLARNCRCLCCGMRPRFFIWLASFVRRSIRWRGVDYLVQAGMLAPLRQPAPEKMALKLETKERP